MRKIGNALTIVLFVMLASATAVSGENISHTQHALAGVDVGNAQCINKNLHVDLEVTRNTNVYRVNGTGPGLPSNAIAYPGTDTFVIRGSGEWSGLYLEYSSDGGATWSTSYRPVTPRTISCPVFTEIPAPGPDMVEIPGGSAVGTFVVDTPLYWAPQADAVTTHVITAGQSLWVTGMDASGQYQQVILSGNFLWVPAGTVSSTYDDTWGGSPLPAQHIED